MKRVNHDSGISYNGVDKSDDSRLISKKCNVFWKKSLHETAIETDIL